MNRRRGGEEGIYRCEIPDAMNVTQNVYIGVYTISTGEWYMYTLVLFNYTYTVVFVILCDSLQLASGTCILLFCSKICSESSM